MVSTEFLNVSNIKVITYNGTIPGEFTRCYPVDVIEENGIWLELNPMAQALPLFLLQLIMITGLNHIIIIFLKPLRQPLIVAELLAGVLLGNSGIGMFRKQSPFLKAVFYISRVMLLETFGNLGLIYYLFILGLEIDLSTIRRIGKRAFSISMGGTLITFAFGTCMYYICMQSLSKTFPLGSLFWGVSLSVTGLPVLADILACLKLLNADFGRTAMSSALVGEIVSWGLFMLVITFIQKRTTLFVVLSAAAFVFLCIYVIRPAILWMTKRQGDGEELSESTVCIILTTVLACGFVTDMLGLTSMVGAFVLGLVIPYEVLGHGFVVFLQGFVTDLFMPVYFTLAGFRFQASVLDDGPAWWLIVVTVVLLSVSKFATTLGTTYFLDAPFNDRLTLGLLSNAKGLLAIITISVGFDNHALDDIGYAIIFIVILITTMSTAPIISFFNRRTRRLLPSKHRSLQRLRPETELRILACVHENHTVAGIINLLESSYATRRSPICVFALQLIELTKQAAAFLIVQSPSHPSSGSPASYSGRTNNQTEHLTDAFENLERESPAFFVHPLTAMSSYDTMHEDICSMAEDKRVTLVLLPFHQRQTIHNRLEESNPSYKDVNDNVLANAPCSVAILVDRGFGAISNENPATERHIVMIYIGGPDDREALAYAARMGSHPAATLTVIRLIPGENAVDLEPKEGDTSLTIYSESEKQIDDNFVGEFRNRTANDNSILYIEKVSNSGDHTVEIIRSIGVKFDLYVVGRGLGIVSPLTAGLAEWSECPELGAIGDLLVTSDFVSTSSVLVVQKYAESKGDSSDESVKTDLLNEGNENIVHVSRRQSRPHFDRYAESRDVEDRY